MKPHDVNKYGQMKANETEQQFLKLAKSVQNDDRMPVGFAARVMARIREQHALETSSAEARVRRFARHLSGTEHVPSAFEKRLLARLRELLTPDPLTVWSRMLWRAVAPCLGVMLLAVLFSAGEPADTSTGQAAGELETADFETVMLASFDDLEYTW